MTPGSPPSSWRAASAAPATWPRSRACGAPPSTPAASGARYSVQPAWTASWAAGPRASSDAAPTTGRGAEARTGHDPHDTQPFRHHRGPAAILVATRHDDGLLRRLADSPRSTRWCWVKWRARAATRSKPRTGSRWRATSRAPARPWSWRRRRWSRSEAELRTCDASPSRTSSRSRPATPRRCAVLAPSTRRIRRAGFIIGPHVNVYNRAALAEHAPLGAGAWVAPLELSLEAVGQSTRRKTRWRARAGRWRAKCSPSAACRWPSRRAASRRATTG